LLDPVETMEGIQRGLAQAGRMKPALNIARDDRGPPLLHELTAAR
jgi:hypothetical protein